MIEPGAWDPKSAQGAQAIQGVQAAPGAAGARALRLHAAGAALEPHAEFDLPAAAARHARVCRVQPGQPLHLFDGRGREWPAQVLALSRTAVRVRLAAQPLVAATRELPLEVTLAFCMPANERVDALVEKATELGVAALQPLMSERSVLRLAGERAERRRAHWQAVAISACEQCGRAHLPAVHPVLELAPWLRDTTAARSGRWLLSASADAAPWPQAWPAPRGTAPVVLLSGPEGGLAADEERAARDADFVPVSLGPRILRADTAPLAALAWLALALG